MYVDMSVTQIGSQHLRSNPTDFGVSPTYVLTHVNVFICMCQYFSIMLEQALTDLHMQNTMNN